MAQETFRALRHRNFRLYVGGMAVSLAGTYMQQVAQSWLVYRLTKSEWMLGVSVFCAYIPMLVLTPFTGLVADRYQRRRIVMVAQTAAMGQALLLAVLTLGGWVQIWHVLLLAVFLGVASAFDVPGRQALLVHLVGKEDLLNAISLNSTTFNAARIVGPPIAGFVVARFGEGVCFGLNAASFLAVLGSLWAMRIVEPGGSGGGRWPTRELLDGFRYAWDKKAVRVLLLTAGLACLSSSSCFTLAPVFADRILNMGSQGYGLLTGAMGVGAVLGTLVLAGRGRARGLDRVLIWCAAGLGLAMLGFAISPSFWFSMAAMLVIGVCLFGQNASNNTAVQTGLEEGFRGRVMGLYSMMVVGMLPVGSLMSGALAKGIGARWTVGLGGLMSLGAAAFVYINRRTLRPWLER
jgi:MFS family permease